MYLLGVLACSIILALAVLFFGFYRYLTRHFDYWKKLGIPYIRPLPLFGNIKGIILQKGYAGKILEGMYRDQKHEPYVGIFMCDKPALLVNDLDIIKNILVKDAHVFLDHNIETDEGVNPIWSNIMFGLKGETWRHTRNKLSPIFTSGKMKAMFHLVNNCAKQLITVLDSVSTNDSPVPVKDTLARFTTDSISTCALGIESNSLSNPMSEVRKYMRHVFDFSFIKGLASTLMIFAPKFCKALKLKFLDDDTAKFFRNTVWETVKYREQHGVVRKDLLDSLMELRKSEKEESEIENVNFDGDMFVAHAFSIFIGGFETSSSATTFLLYELARHPHIQQRVREEICEVLQKHNNEVTYEAIQEMKYLDMVINETLRIYPVLGFLDRVCMRDYDLPDPSGKGTFTLKAGTGVFIPLMGIHNDPEHFPDPFKFDPERFTEDNKLNRHNYSYFPFGEGPRICIGKRFGLMQMKISLSHILARYEVSSCRETPLQPSFESRSFILQTKDEIYLTFKRFHI